MLRIYAPGIVALMQDIQGSIKLTKAYEPRDSVGELRGLREKGYPDLAVAVAISARRPLVATGRGHSDFAEKPLLYLGR